jgi:hypothetical protein
LSFVAGGENLCYIFLMKKTLTLIGLTLISAFALTGCVGISAGTITGKVVEPERRYATTTMAGKVPITTWHTDDEDYCFELIDQASKDKDTGYQCVDKTTYDKFSVGDFFDAEAK